MGIRAQVELRRHPFRLGRVMTSRRQVATCMTPPHHVITLLPPLLSNKARTLTAQDAQVLGPLMSLHFQLIDLPKWVVAEARGREKSEACSIRQSWAGATTGPDSKDGSGSPCRQRHVPDLGLLGLWAILGRGDNGTRLLGRVGLAVAPKVTCRCGSYLGLLGLWAI